MNVIDARQSYYDIVDRKVDIDTFIEEQYQIEKNKIIECNIIKFVKKSSIDESKLLIELNNYLNNHLNILVSKELLQEILNSLKSRDLIDYDIKTNTIKYKI